MVSNLTDVLSTIGAGLAGSIAAWLHFRKKLSDHRVEMTSNKTQIDILDSLKYLKDIASEAEEKCRQKLNVIDEENRALKARIAELEAENLSYSSQIKILNDIIQSLQLSLNQTKTILEEQIKINEQLSSQLKLME